MLQAVIYYIVTIILTKELVIATDQCTKYRFKSPFFPGVSCEDIYNKNPESHDRSGYYWILDGPSRVYCGMNYTGSSCEVIYNNNPEVCDKPGYYCINDSQWTYCNMTDTNNGDTICTCAGVRGGWTRIGHFNISAGDECPSGWAKDTESGVSFCRPPGSIPSALCYSTRFSTNGKTYSGVCGRARGYQKGDVWGFWGSTAGYTIDGSYVDGLSITHGTGPRHHIWTYAVGRFDHSSVSYGCPCSPYKATPPPAYINGNYYCESGTTASPANGAMYYLYDPLWDGSGCSKNNTCYSNDRLRPIMLKNLPIMLLSIAQKNSPLCSKLCSCKRIMLKI